MQCVYVLTGNGLEPAARYVRGLSLSVQSLRRFHPDAVVHCLCDSTLYRELVATRHPLGRMVDHLVECPDAVGGPVHRSRWIKTSLRSRLEGRFVYLDADSVVAGSLDRLAQMSAGLGITLDAFFPDAAGQFPAWLRPHYRRLGWPPTERYYSGGILCVDDTPALQRLFGAWHEGWHQTVRIGLVIDQPSLNRAIQREEPDLELLPETYNFLVGRDDRTVPEAVRVLAFLASQPDQMHERYQAALAAVETDTVALETLIAAGTPLRRSTRAWPWPREWSRRMREALAQATARAGLRDATRE